MLTKLLKLKEVEIAFWNSYIKTLSLQCLPVNPWVEAAPAGNAGITDSLLQLYLDGKKCAGSSVVEDFLTNGDPVPKVGNYWIVLNSKGEPTLILKTDKVVINKFRDVPEEIAIAEGEGDLSLNFWRMVHARFFEPNLEKWGIKHIDDATIITEYFKLVHKRTEAEVYQK